MNKLLAVKNISREGPGLLEGILKSNGIGFDLVDLDKGEEFPDPTPYQAVVVFGGPDSANDQTAKMQAEIARIKQVLEADIAYLGICLGLQTLVKAGGGQVVKSPVKEVGFVDEARQPFSVNLTDTGKNDPLFEGLADSLRVFHLHGETVELGDNMTLLASGKHCQNQIVRVGDKAYGIQSHFELTEDMLGVWANQDPDLTPLGKNALLEQYHQIQTDYTQTGEQLFTNFLNIADLL